MFGNLNNMVTVWVHRFKDYFNKVNVELSRVETIEKGVRGKYE